MERIAQITLERDYVSSARYVLDMRVEAGSPGAPMRLVRYLSENEVVQISDLGSLNIVIPGFESDWRELCEKAEVPDKVAAETWVQWVRRRLTILFVKRGVSFRPPSPSLIDIGHDERYTMRYGESSPADQPYAVPFKVGGIWQPATSGILSPAMIPIPTHAYIAAQYAAFQKAEEDEEIEVPPMEKEEVYDDPFDTEPATDTPPDDETFDPFAPEEEPDEFAAFTSEQMKYIDELFEFDE